MYILKINNNAFVEAIGDNKIIISSDYTKAFSSETIGDAMRYAIKVNDFLGNPLAKVIEYAH